MLGFGDGLSGWLSQKHGMRFDFNEKEKQCPMCLPDLKIVVTESQFVISIGCLKDWNILVNKRIRSFNTNAFFYIMCKAKTRIKKLHDMVKTYRRKKFLSIFTGFLVLCLNGCDNNWCLCCVICVCERRKW